MSETGQGEATGRCGCGRSRVQDGMWASELYRDGSEHIASKFLFCPHCGHQLLAEGRTLAPATELERRDAKAMEEMRVSGGSLANRRKWVVMGDPRSGEKVLWVVMLGYVLRGQADDPADAILAAAASLIPAGGTCGPQTVTSAGGTGEPTG